MTRLLFTVYCLLSTGHWLLATSITQISPRSSSQVKQRYRVERVATIVPADVMPRDPAELVIDKRNQAIESTTVTPGIRLEELSDLTPPA